uniref:ExbD/TolR family protein n=1 Tax=Desertifilum tharense IPPAS B-1220 TaxID=1781255 RepID=A0ACD5GR09_9CYAN
MAAVGLTRQQAISVDLPQANTGTAQMRDMMIVSIDAVGQTYVEKELIFSREELRRRVLAYRAQHPSGLIVLYASRTAIYEDVVQILDLLRSVGGDRVALATLPSTGEPTSPNPGATVPPFPNIPGLTPLPNNPVNPALPGQPNNSTLDPYRTWSFASFTVPGCTDSNRTCCTRSTCTGELASTPASPSKPAFEGESHLNGFPPIYRWQHWASLLH